MVTKRVDIPIVAKDRASGVFRKVDRSSSRLSAGFSRLGVAATAAISAFGAQFAVRGALAAFGEQEKAEERLKKALDRRGLAVAENSALMFEAASALQLVSTVGDEAAITTQAVAISMGASVKNAIRLTRASADLASAMGISNEQSARQLTKTFGGYAGELGEIIPEIKLLTKEQLAAGGAIDLVEKKFRGFSQREASTFTGQMKQFRNATGDAAEAIGRVLAPAILTMTGLIRSSLPDIVQWITLLSEGFEAIADVPLPITGTFGGFLKEAQKSVIDIGATSFALATGKSFKELREFKRLADLEIDGKFNNTRLGLSLDDLIARASDESAKILSALGKNKKSSSRQPRTTATLAASRFLTGVRGADENLVLTVEKKTEKNTLDAVKELGNIRQLLREMLQQGRLGGVATELGVFQ